MLHPYFNPRLPRGRRRGRRCVLWLHAGISIHASLAGGDRCACGASGIPTNFNPRLPRGRRRRSMPMESLNMPHFNPRLPRGRRRHNSTRITGCQYFNPRLPRGRRRGYWICLRREPVFQSTPPSREATLCQRAARAAGAISIHASLAGGDGRVAELLKKLSLISIHASLAGGDMRRKNHEVQYLHFNPRLPRGRRPRGEQDG